MKPAAFEYVRPATLDEVCAMLAGGDDVRIIAGGQTLVPLMAMRLARPKRLIDIARMHDLAFIRDDGDAVTVGAVTRQCVVEHDPIVREKVPLLAKAMPFVGHAPIRARGTVGGSLANADPAAEIALVAVTLGATLAYREGSDTSEIAASDFLRRADDDGFAGGGLPHRRTLSGLARRAHRRRLPGGQCPQERFCVRRGRGADRARRAWNVPARRAGDRRGHVLPAAARYDGTRRTLAPRNHSCARHVAAVLAGIDLLSDLHASAAYRRRAAESLAVRAVEEAYRAAEGVHAR